MVKDNKVAIYSDKVIYMISSQEILLIRALGAYTTITLISGKSIRISKNMKTVMSYFPKAKCLLKVHRSTCINIDFMSNIYYNKSKKLIILLKTGLEVRASLVTMTQILSMINKKR